MHTVCTCKCIMLYRHLLPLSQPLLQDPVPSPPPQWRCPLLVGPRHLLLINHALPPLHNPSLPVSILLIRLLLLILLYMILYYSVIFCLLCFVYSVLSFSPFLPTHTHAYTPCPAPKVADSTSTQKVTSRQGVCEKCHQPIRWAHRLCSPSICTQSSIHKHLTVYMYMYCSL